VSIVCDEYLGDGTGDRRHREIPDYLLNNHDERGYVGGMILVRGLLIRIGKINSSQKKVFKLWILALRCSPIR
jgi:hypothetical protein